jgi:hypothetical protein
MRELDNSLWMQDGHDEGKSSGGENLRQVIQPVFKTFSECASPSAHIIERLANKKLENVQYNAGSSAGSRLHEALNKMVRTRRYNRSRRI